jgi:hypothetical protein
MGATGTPRRVAAKLFTKVRMKDLRMFLLVALARVLGIEK